MCTALSLTNKEINKNKNKKDIHLCYSCLRRAIGSTLRASWHRAAFERHSHSNLPILKPNNAGLNCSVIHLHLKWKTRHQTSTWSWWSSNAVTRWRQHMSLWALQSFHVYPRHDAPAASRLLTPLGVAAHTCVNNCSLWWTLHTWLVLLMSTFTQSWGFPQLRAWPQTWRPCLQDETPSVWLRAVSITEQQMMLWHIFSF